VICVTCLLAMQSMFLAVYAGGAGWLFCIRCVNVYAGYPGWSSTMAILVGWVAVLSILAGWLAGWLAAWLAGRRSMLSIIAG